MKRLLAASIAVLMAIGMATAATDIMSSVPLDSFTVTDWYKQPVYDSNDNKLGDVKDVLVDNSGKINAMILGIGGILGAGEKDVAVPFEAVKKTMKNNEAYLTLDVTKDNLKSAPGLKYDRNKTSWVPDTSGNNTSR
jgi:sporulation protein YlmC with PRC-barrel domain